MKPGAEPDRIYLQHMLDCIARIEEYVGGDEQRFCESRLIQDAVVRNLQTLAESSQRLSEPTKTSEPKIPWRATTGLRNILVHDHLGIDVNAIWQVVAVELVPLGEALTRMSDKLNHGRIVSINGDSASTAARNSSKSAPAWPNCSRSRLKWACAHSGWMASNRCFSASLTWPISAKYVCGDAGRHLG